MIPGGTRFIGISESVNLTERKSTGLNAETQPYTMDDITSTVKPYKVFTALLTQSGGDNELYLSQGDSLTIGVTYLINNNEGVDFTNVGAPNNNIDTLFVATGTTPNSWGSGSGSTILIYNTGAPVATVLENTIGNVWFIYDNAGTYFMYSDGLFTINKTYAPSIIINNTPTIITVLSNGNINITEFIVNEGDDILNNTPIEIRVYN